MSTEAATLSTESIATSSANPTGTQSCTVCGAPLVADQRYCLQCGERRVPVSSFLRAGPPTAPSPPSAPPIPPSSRQGAGQGGLAARNPALTLIAGVGVLLLAMGVGVLIGRSSAPAPRSAPAQVVTVGSTAGSSPTTSSEATFTSDWPSGKSGYAVQLQTLAESGTTVSQIEAAKTSATSKGASAVGALKSEEFSSLTAGDYIVYSGEYSKKAEAQKALSKLKKSFPAAKVIKIANGSTGGSGSSKARSSNPNDHSSIEHPAPPSVLEGESKAKGKSYEEKSAQLPNVVET
ncbi:MAG TPA: SPOR domain-containing protein [Solirubrobacteraceae bacterium]